MPYLKSKNEQKSAIITAIIAVIIIVLIFNFGLKYFDPPIEYGINVNFGTTDFGSGNMQPVEALKPMHEEAPDVEEEKVEEESDKIIEENKIEEVANKTSEDVATQQNEESIAIKKQEEARKKLEAENRERIEKERIEKERIEKERIEKERIEREKKEAIAKKKREQEAKKAKLDALMGGLNTKGNATGGEGNDKKPGDKGKVTGDPNASGYYGLGGSGSGGNYRLGNRKALTKPKPTYDCNEEGDVYVRISVDKNGKVIAAQPGIKGTTNSAPCLLQGAKEAALKTKFNPDSNAPAKQVGLIIYNFSLKSN